MNSQEQSIMQNGSNLVCIRQNPQKDRVEVLHGRFFKQPKSLQYKPKFNQTISNLTNEVKSKYFENQYIELPNYAQLCDKSYVSRSPFNKQIRVLLKGVSTKDLQSFVSQFVARSYDPHLQIVQSDQTYRVNSKVTTLSIKDSLLSEADDDQRDFLYYLDLCEYPEMLLLKLCLAASFTHQATNAHEEEIQLQLLSGKLLGLHLLNHHISTLDSYGFKSLKPVEIESFF